MSFVFTKFEEEDIIRDSGYKTMFDHLRVRYRKLEVQRHPPENGESFELGDLGSRDSLGGISNSQDKDEVRPELEKEFERILQGWRVGSFIIGVFFMFACLVQHNDPDPWLWIPAYLIPCLLSLHFSFGGVPGKIIARWMDELINIHIIYCLGLGVWTLTLTCWDHLRGHPEVDVASSSEEAKELFGLCLVVAWESLLKGLTFFHLGAYGLWLAIALTVSPIIAWICVEIFEENQMGHCN